MIPFSVEMVDILRQGATQRMSPKKINRDRHSSFTERTQRSPNAFRFGLRAGNSGA
jgi:hypothetical protein